MIDANKRTVVSFSGGKDSTAMLDSKAKNDFRRDYTLDELEIRFQLEDEWKNKGYRPSMRNKAFKAEFENRCNS